MATCQVILIGDTPTVLRRTNVKTNDLRLSYAKILANLVGDNQDTCFLEVGAGSGFTTHYLASMGFVVEGSELSEYRVNGAKLLGKLKKTTTSFFSGKPR